MPSRVLLMLHECGAPPAHPASSRQSTITTCATESNAKREAFPPCVTKFFAKRSEQDLGSECSHCERPVGPNFVRHQQLKAKILTLKSAIWSQYGPTSPPHICEILEFSLRNLMYMKAAPNCACERPMFAKGRMDGEIVLYLQGGHPLVSQGIHSDNDYPM